LQARRRQRVLMLVFEVVLTTSFGERQGLQWVRWQCPRALRVQGQVRRRPQPVRLQQEQVR
jgi:hypothetical protein